MDNLSPLQLVDPVSATRTYDLADPASREAIIIDPVAEMLDRDVAVLKERWLQLRWMLETHVHADHVTSATPLAQRTGTQVAVARECDIQTDVRLLKDGDVVAFDAGSVSMLHAPGHTAGSSCYLWDAGALYDSITGKLLVLPDTTVVWPGRDCKDRTHSTIAHEREANARIAGKNGDEFIATMVSLNLPPPKRLGKAVPANPRLGG